MGGAADVFQPKFRTGFSAVSQMMPCAHGHCAQVARELDCVRGRGRKRIQLIINNDDGRERVDLLQVYGGVGFTTKLESAPLVSNMRSRRAGETEVPERVMGWIHFVAELG